MLKQHHMIFEMLMDFGLLEKVQQINTGVQG